ncbi:hypothetical protein [Nocardiopsis composta]|uniref:Uncharacterized protein n=1 Tax=Nocardiopsis composta TaxID=157465 RepID=A0A7W8VCP1_9ACTN|nr:hypothetical protein [Nocardiopsis composta]MBB5431185.1 hypothetical protein [Nocardiopsis composta]
MLVSSTWGAKSLFGRHPLLARRLLAALPRDEYRVGIALHPNIWHGHGPGQVEAWLADAVRAGLIVLPPDEGWRAAVVAADAVFGDLGSVSYYAAALGRPVVLDRSGADAVAADSPIARLLAAATPYDPRRPVRALLREAEGNAERTGALAGGEVSSYPGRSLALLREAMYRLMGAAEPEEPPVVPAVPAPVPRPGPAHPALWTTVAEDPGGALRITRTPAAVPRPGSPAPAFLMVWEEEPDRRLAELADLVVAREAAGEAAEDGVRWCRETLDLRAGPHAAARYGRDRCVLHARSASGAVTVAASAEWPRPGFDPSLLPALLYQRVLDGGGIPGPGHRLRLRLPGTGEEAAIRIEAR